MKLVLFHPKAREAVRSFPDEIRDQLGRALYRLQIGESLGLPLSRPMPSVGTGISELRLRGEDGIYRAFYLVRNSQGIMICHAFQKKTQKTPPLEIELARKRVKEMLNG